MLMNCDRPHWITSCVTLGMTGLPCLKPNLEMELALDGVSFFCSSFSLISSYVSSSTELQNRLSGASSTVKYHK